MAKRKKVTRKGKKLSKPFNRAVYEKLEDKLMLAQNAMLDERPQESARLCDAVLRHRQATKRQKSEACQFMANMFMQTQDFSLACKALTAAIELTPTDWMLYYNRSLAMLYTTRLAQSLKDIEQAAALCDKDEMRSEISERLASISGIVHDACADRGPNFTVDDLLVQQALFSDANDDFANERYAEAEVKFEQAIAMGDVLPQPWFNLGSIYMLRKEWDSAEKAWLRALEIDPEYEFAHNNLAMLPDLRAGKELPQTSNLEPMKGKVENLTLRTINR